MNAMKHGMHSRAIAEEMRQIREFLRLCERQSKEVTG